MYIHILETRSMTSKCRVHWRETETAGERERERERAAWSLFTKVSDRYLHVFPRDVMCVYVCLGNRLAYLDENINNITYAAARWYGVDVTAPDAENVPASEVEYADMEVYVSAFVERLFDVNVDRYTHDVGMRIMMSWNDPSFPMLVKKATNKWKETGECDRFCGPISTECCDEVFLPGMKQETRAN